MDHVQRFIFEDLDIRGARVCLGPAWRQMHGGRNYSPAVRDLLGEITAVTALIGSNLKSSGRLSFQLKGQGPVSLLLVDCDSQLRLRGMATAAPDVPELPVPQLLGDGQLALTLELEASRQPYQSFVSLNGDTLSAIFENYLTQSEQSPTRLWLQADAVHACGLYLQRLPTADARDADGWNRVQQLANTISRAELALPTATLLGRLFPDETLRLFEPQIASYHCPRDEAKALELLRLLGRDEIESALIENGTLTLTDDICNQEYSFDRSVLGLFDKPH